jgi:hypothetical protein
MDRNLGRKKPYPRRILKETFCFPFPKNPISGHDELEVTTTFLDAPLTEIVRWSGEYPYGVCRKG